MFQRLALAVLVAAATLPAFAAPQTYKIDPAHTSVVASWNHFGFSNPVANFGGADGSIVGASNPASRAEVLVLYLTGLGPVSNTPATGEAASLTTLSNTVIQPKVTIGGFDAPVIFSGLTPGFIGLAQMNIVVPPGLTPGVYPLSVTIDGQTSNSATIAVK